MARRSSAPDFIEALARGLDVIKAFEPHHPSMTLSALATRANLARPTTHRILLTLAELGYVRATDFGFSLTPKVLELSLAFVQSAGLWDAARPHMERLVAQTNESTSIVQLDGCDIVYVARVAVPKVVALNVHIGTRFPALQTALGQVILADLQPDELEQTLAQPSRSGVTPRWLPDSTERDEALKQVREQGWALADGWLAMGIRSVAVPLRGASGRVIAAMNVNTNAAETPVEKLLGEYLPLLRETADLISHELRLVQSMPIVVTGS
ncbi:IclR family transcriptional regulator domain-containing protein [Rhizomonospora bruguierae]|uniref:IclR family transcriptional regulator domain-containing protein n=1 Tax=Rhizomonospora bruguierae TaxID=1581705 RepID=UPI0020BE69F9|nr:IclR family transcriptional regulator C-terminal domain-containing protein [Micromonospora sp. NBRC 107566]